MSELVDSVERRSAPLPRIDSTLALVLALTWSAGLIHAVAAIGHLDYYAPFAVFFEALAVAQFLLGVALYRAPSRRLLWIGALGSLAVVALWCISRTAGVPIGPHPWSPEPVGAIDAVCSADEVVLAIVVFGRLAAGPRGPLRRIVTATAAGSGLFLVLLSSLVLVSGGHVH
jgi:hypothetical protein